MPPPRRYHFSRVDACCRHAAAAPRRSANSRRPVPPLLTSPAAPPAVRGAFTAARACRHNASRASRVICLMPHRSPSPPRACAPVAAHDAAVA